MKTWPILNIEVIVGESITFPGGSGKGGLSPDFMKSHGIEVINLNDPDCIAIMQDFIEIHPELWNEDIGVTEAQRSSSWLA